MAALLVDTVERDLADDAGAAKGDAAAAAALGDATG
jgi:hypothetical protein